MIWMCLFYLSIHQEIQRQGRDKASPRGSILLSYCAKVSPLTAQYFCEIFYFVRESGRENMLIHTYVACVTIALAVCLVHAKNRRWIKEWYYKRIPQYVRTRGHVHILSDE